MERAGTFAPSLRASDNPIAIACFGFVTFRPERPERSFPFFISRIERSTLRPAFGEYFRAFFFRLDVFFFRVAVDFLRVDVVFFREVVFLRDDVDFLRDVVFLRVDDFLCALRVLATYNPSRFISHRRTHSPSFAMFAIYERADAACFPERLLGTMSKQRE